MLRHTLYPYRYVWPAQPLAGWHVADDGRASVRSMPESAEALAADSRWPALFPSPICLVTVRDGNRVALEKVVGASIVNRFPYTIALSFCRQHLSTRHHVRSVFTEMLERGGSVAVQFLPPGPALDAAMNAILTVPEEQSHERIARTGLATRHALTNGAPVLAGAYMVYEARLVQPGKDFEGRAIHAQPWKDVGSHRVYFLEINAIQLREDIARGRSQIRWRALPAWQPQQPLQPAVPDDGQSPQDARYQKGYSPEYAFPSSSTTAFAGDESIAGMAVKRLSPLPQDQVEVDNDKARWPCFFPSSCGMITTWAAPGVPNVMPCGSTTIVSRHPLVIAACVSYARINVRYAPRATLDILQRTGQFGCGVPFLNETVIKAIRMTGNISIETDPRKVAHAGLAIEPVTDGAPVLTALPVHFDCRIVDQVRLGTHIMFLGEVSRIRVRSDVTPQNPLEWCPWADVAPMESKS